MPAQAIPGFLRKLAASNNHPLVRAALRFLILTALRTGEILELRRADFSADRRKLTIPGCAHEVA